MTKKTRKAKTVGWRYSEAKKLMAQDMIDGIVATDIAIKDIKKLYDQYYAGHPFFKDFPFDKELFKGRVSRLQHSVQRYKEYSKMDSEAFAKDRLVYPQKTHNVKGEPLWKGSEAAECLIEDMKNGLHLTMKPQELRETRECYKDFNKTRFSKRIDQMKQKAKPFGATPGQTKSKKKKKGSGNIKVNSSLSRRGLVQTYANST
mmetsp:Transcript_6587/g.9625  ORF Transcript_6587/g.9625 Transcript_6587/m.9625 type:complete len:203 (-) Transcript_6587:60-668(-)|eukprot:CAMPEP_0194027940 /NCGR_PEP_ID=MMETSP0009_2-20130614/1976_1 /TAXON_ID=210454 /ORGANISM="Grammatophora oceanica, Strain CCMP 410" /LENGTH=202 /DNA_ID=CAMNT_0038667151 /DNA_START=11 /DNA_END=622 /DNA_ORIENTATION=+